MRHATLMGIGLTIVLAALGACQPATVDTEDTGGEGAPAATADATEAPTEEPAPTEETEADTGLSGAWTLVSMGDPSSPIPVPEGLTVTANFEMDVLGAGGNEGVGGGRVSGTSACNSYTAPVAVDGDSLTIGQAASTMMACDEPAMTMEQEFMAALQSVTGYEVTDDGLTLMYGDGMELVFTPALAGGLAGTSWQVTSYNNGMEAVVSLVPDSAITLNFTDDGVNGQACNGYTGSFSQDGDSIAIGPIAGTRMMCPGEGVMEQERMYFAALEAATTWSVNGPTLTLRDASDAMQVVATAAEPAATE